MLLEHPQQLDLRAGIEFADLVEKYGAPVGHGETPFARSDRTGERSFDMAEHLALEKRSRDAAEIDSDERRRRPPAIGMYGVCYQFLARAVLAEYKHRSIGRRHPSDSLEHLFQPTAVAYDAVAQQAAFSRTLHAVKFESSSHPLQHGVGLPWLGDEVERSEPHALHGQIYAAPRRDEYDRHLGRQHLEPLQQLESLLSGSERNREIHIHHHQIRTRDPQRLQRLFGRCSHSRLVTSTAEQQTQREPDGFIVVDYQYHNYRFSTAKIAKKKQPSQSPRHDSGHKATKYGWPIRFFS